MSKKYFSEILLLTKSLYADELQCWLEWHLNILGVDHIVLFDNESIIDVSQVIKSFPQDKIEYHYIQGWPDQYALYNNYLKKTEAQWVIPLDDDEYLYLSDTYKNINQFIISLQDRYHRNMFYILWVNMLSGDKIYNHSDLYINTHTYYSFEACRKIAGSWSRDDGWGKCLFNLDQEYSFRTEKHTGHIPLCTNGDNTVVLVNGTATNIINPRSIHSDHLFYRKNERVFNKDCFIAHYHYRTKEDWVRKCNTWDVSSLHIHLQDKVYVYDKIYEYRSEFLPCVLLKDRWKSYKE